MLRCVWRTPFGTPVEPEVYMIRASSRSSRGMTVWTGSWAARAAAKPPPGPGGGGSVEEGREPLDIAGHGDEPGQPGIDDGVPQWPVREQVVQRDADGPRLPGSEQPDQVLGAVGQEEPVPLAGRDTGFVQVG